MVEDNIKDFTINWVIFGLLATCLIAFAITFMYENNPYGLNDGSLEKLTSTDVDLNTRLYSLEGDGDELLNITSKTDPEVSQLGSKDSVATAYKMKDSGVSFWTSAKSLIGWVFTGEIGKILLGTFGGLIGFLSVYFIIKLIRTGY